MRLEWRNHLINFILIVFSILMAFQLERWAADSREDRLVDAHLREIVKETEFNQAQIDRVLESMQESRLRLDSLLTLIHTSDNPQVINQVVLRAMDVPVAYLKQTAYTTFVETGDIRYLDDFALKAELVSLYEYYKLSETYGKLLLNTYENGFFDFIQRELDLYRARPVALEVYRDRSFVNAIASIRYFLARNITMLERDRTRMTEFMVRASV